MDDSRSDDTRAAEPKARRRKPARAENAIRWAQAPAAHSKNTAAPEAAEERERKPRPQAKASLRIDRIVPPQVREHFVQVGTHFYFADGARAFTDHGAKLATPSENTQLIRDLVDIAQARGWQRIVVSGTERFRKEAWVAAREAGLEVKGYRASEFDEARMVRRVAHPPAAAEVREPSPGEGVAGQADEARERKSAPSRQHRGRLIEHGLAPYQHDPHAPMSYFVKLETANGDREVWGVDLERAFRESLSRPQVGDEVVVRAVKREPVMVKGHALEEGGASEARTVHRNRWLVEKKEFLVGREKAAQVLRDPNVAAAKGSRQHPELLGAYLQMRAAELASKQFRDPQDREKFVAMVRQALADSVARGEALPAVRVRSQDAERGEPEPDAPRDRGVQGRER